MNSYAIFDSSGALLSLISTNDAQTAKANCPPDAILLPNPDCLTYAEAGTLWLLRDKLLPQKD